MALERARRDSSAGGVIARPQGEGWEICLIARRHDERVVWGLPKGHLEAGEQLEQAAIREVREETGLRGEIIAKIGAIRYWFTLKLGERWAPAGATGASRIAKTVHFFLLRFLEGDTSAHDDEVHDAQWVPIERAIERIAYDNEREIVRKAAELLPDRDTA